MLPLLEDYVTLRESYNSKAITRIVVNKLGHNSDVIIGRSYDFCKTLCFSFRKDNVDHISGAGLAADATKD